jgi:hypothetical protein
MALWVMARNVRRLNGVILPYNKHEIIRKDYCMPMKLEWMSEPDGIIYWGFVGYWTWGEYFMGIRDMINLASSSAQPQVYIICDLSESKHIPFDVLHNVQFGSPKNEEESKGWALTVIVGGGTFVKTIFSLVIRLRPFLANHYRLANSLDEALNLIAEHRKTYSAAD